MTESQIEELECEECSHGLAKHDRDLGDTSLITHKIDEGKAKVLNCRPNRINKSALAALEKHVDNILKHSIMEESPGSLWSSLVVLVFKPNNKDSRFYFDMRNLNKVTTILTHVHSQE